MPPAPPPRPPSPRSSSAPTPVTASVPIEIRKPGPIVPRMILYATEKFGKTSFASFAPDPIVLMVRDTGYDTLLGAGSVPAVRAAEVNEWQALLSTVRGVSGCKTLVIDGITGAEKACQEYICNTHFGGDWGEHGFAAYAKGYDLAATEWLKLLSALDRLRDSGIMIVLLGHARMKQVSNPMGANYDHFEPDCHPKAWAGCAKWADAILFGKFHSIVEISKREAAKKIAEQKGKAIGGTQRVIFTEPHDAFVAGNRYSMESEIWIQGGPESMWDQVISQIRKPAAE